MELADWFAEFIDEPEVLDTIRSSETRIRSVYTELLSGYKTDARVLNVTVREASGANGPVTVSNIPFFSLCGHHLLPYYGEADVLYWPGEVVTGLGKIPRLVALLAHKLVIQEHLTRNIAQEVLSQIKPRAVRVRTVAVHLCMISRGPLAGGAKTECEYELGDMTLLRQ